MRKEHTRKRTLRLVRAGLYSAENWTVVRDPEGGFGFEWLAEGSNVGDGEHYFHTLFEADNFVTSRLTEQGQLHDPHP